MKKIMSYTVGKLENWTAFEKVWLGFFTVLLIASSALMQDDLFGIITTLTGMLCVVMVAKGIRANYFWGFINVIMYTIVAYKYNYAGDFVLNLFYYLPMNVIGLFMWNKHYNTEEDEIEGKGFTIPIAILYIAILGIATYLVGIFMPVLNSLLGMDSNPLPFVDAFTTAGSILAMWLMVRRYKEQWLLWIVVDIFSVLMWFKIGNIAMTIMFTAYLINAIYGYINWVKLAKKAKEGI